MRKNDIRASHVEARPLKRVKICGETDGKNSRSCVSVPMKKTIRRTAQKGGRAGRRPPLSVVSQSNPCTLSSLLRKHPISQHVLSLEVYNDESWITQQQRLYTEILNEVLASYDEMSDSWKGMSKESIRSAAFDYYQSMGFQVIVRRLNSVLPLPLYVKVLCCYRHSKSSDLH